MATSIRPYKSDSNSAAPTSFDATPISMTGLTWMSSLRDLPREHGFESLRLEGSLAAGLSGTLSRKQGNQRLAHSHDLISLEIEARLKRWGREMRLLIPPDGAAQSQRLRLS